MAGTPVDALLDIIELIGRIARQTAGLTHEQFLDDPDVLDATAFRLLAIGEAAKSLDEGLKSRNPSIPWHQILGMRNVLAHEYFLLESEIIWETVKTGLPKLERVRRLELHASGWESN